MLLLLILAVWALGLMLVAGLCFAARLGDSGQVVHGALTAEQAYAGNAEAVAPAGARSEAVPAIGAERVMPVPSRHEIAA